MSQEDKLIGTWSGTHLLNTPVQVAFNKDHTVRFNGDSGIWYTTNDQNNTPMLNMTFGNAVLLSNPYILVGDSTLAIMTDRDNLILQRVQQVQQCVPMDLLFLVQQYNNRQATNGSYDNEYLPLQPNAHVGATANEAWVSLPSMPKIYQNDHWGVHFYLPPTWFYSITDYLPVMLSCLEPGMIIGRYYRPANEQALDTCYKAGYGERNVWFHPSDPSLTDISSTVFPKDSLYCTKVLSGEYKEKLGSLKARLLAIFNTFGDCFVFFGITSTNEKKFNDLSNVMDTITRSLSFSPPKSVPAPQAIFGTYFDRHSRAVISLTRDFRFDWRCDGNIDEKFGTGSWDVLGSDREGELHFHYDNGYYKKVMYVFANDNKIAFDQSAYDVC